MNDNGSGHRVFGHRVFIGTRNNDFIVGNRLNNFMIGSWGYDKIDGKDGFDTVDYRFLGQKITLKAKGVIDKGNVGTDQILNMEKIVGAKKQANTIDGSPVPGFSNAGSFDINLSEKRLTINGLGAPLNFVVKNFVDIVGTKNDDTIIGNGQDNTFFGSEGNDDLNGGDGTDRVDYSGLGQKITLKAEGVIDKGSAGTDQILNIEEIVGATGQDNVIDGTVPGGGPSSFDVDLSAKRLTVNNIPGIGDLTLTVENFVNVTGTSNADTIVGNNEDNLLIGGEDDDKLSGLGGSDTLVGVDPLSSNPGFKEVDTLMGGANGDVFALGDASNVYYLDSGSDDFADIKDFQSNVDKIRLKGGIGDYSFDDNSSIFFEGDLIAQVSGTFNPDTDFIFVPM